MQSLSVFLLIFLVIKKNSFLFFYSIFLSICLEDGEVLEVVLPGREQITYLAEGGVTWWGTGGKGKLYRSTVK